MARELRKKHGGEQKWGGAEADEVFAAEGCQKSAGCCTSVFHGYEQKQKNCLERTASAPVKRSVNFILENKNLGLSLDKVNASHLRF